MIGVSHQTSWATHTIRSCEILTFDRKGQIQQSNVKDNDGFDFIDFDRSKNALIRRRMK